ncbi:MAG: ROK family protein [Balneolaceae bacterium]
MADVVAGIDLGGTTTKVGIVTTDGQIIAKKRIGTDSSMTYEEYFQFLCNLLDHLSKTVNGEVELRAIGIGAPNGNCFTGMIDDASNLSWKGKVPVVKLIEKNFNLPAFLSNDANSAAIGEMNYGRAKGMKNFAVITMGTGLGCGIVVNGELILGHHGHAAEIGHSTVFFDGRLCSCGRKGCLETYVSGPGLIRTVENLIRETDTVSRLRSIQLSRSDSHLVSDAAKSGDKLALQAFDYTGKILGMKLSDLVTYIDPEAIILLGGLAKAGELILNPAKKYLEMHLLQVYRDKIKLYISGLNNDEAGILGAAASAWNGLHKLEEPVK